MRIALRRWWRYVGTLLGVRLEEAADPKVQLEQAIGDARDQHRLLTEQAANVIANQVLLQGRLDRAIEEYAQVTTSARQALVLADEARRTGDDGRVATLESAAAGFAARLIAMDREIDALRRSLLEATQASDRARQAVKKSSAVLQKRLAQREALLSRLDQAQMQEQMNAAMRQLNAGPDGDVPTFDEVRDKIDRRLAAAKAMSEVSGSSLDLQMLEVEDAQREAETAARLEDLRAQLGIRTMPVEHPALAATTAIDVTPGPEDGAPASDGAA